MSATEALSKIRAGLKAHNSPSNFASLEPYIGAPMTRKALNEAVHSVLMKRDSLRTAAANFTKAFEAKETAIKADVSEMGFAVEERANGTKLRQDLMGDTARRAEMAKRINRARNDLAKEGAEGREAMLAAIRVAQSKVDAVRNVWSDPVALLGRATAGESALRIYKDNLAGSRPATLEARIREAVLSGNRPMLAAALAVLDSMDPEEAKHVNIDRAECAAYAMGDEWTSALHHLAALDLAVLEAERAVAQIESGAVARDKLLAIGKLKLDLAALSGEISFDEYVQAEAQGLNPEIDDEAEEAEPFQEPPGVVAV